MIISKKKNYNHKRGQVLAEIAVYGSIILFIFATLLSYLQHLNDQQYLKMETFRRTLMKAHNYQGLSLDRGGAAVQLVHLENRHHSDILGGFREGERDTVSASSSVNWQVPNWDFEGSSSLLSYRINEDERNIIVEYTPTLVYVGGWGTLPMLWTFPYSDSFILNNWFRMEAMDFSAEKEFSETNVKEERLPNFIPPDVIEPAVMVNTRESSLMDNVTTRIAYSLPCGLPIDIPREYWLTFWEPTQGNYRDIAGQYEYSELYRDNVIERGRTWETEF